MRDCFTTMYGKDLIDDLKSELGGNLEDVTVAIMDPPTVYDAKCLRKAMKVMGQRLATVLTVMEWKYRQQ